ncbi:hypothetical protein TNIN_352181 [Trichonephila inaurata madagascariensis]|uniref:Uncharacterized protein n=1 Tax=Trichonephila inaurata madagascariensis TaxID=2747483 RepID=A0A8X6WPI6_9ARAC|nr:hypothetical protein TNIN_352181 [Trichonephila inaurata madagascariensis]
MLTLKEITQVKIVTVFVNDSKLRRKIVCSEEKIWKRLIRKKLSVLGIPLALQGEIIALVKPITLDVDFWRRDHDGIFTTKQEFSLKFCFHYDGTVDRIKTADLLIRSKWLSVRTRFVLACQYWSRWDVLTFFENSHEQQEIEFYASIRKKTKD